ncbi:hypothetical protein BJV77DRAFT_1026851, partial [Russula vinacea]
MLHPSAALVAFSRHTPDPDSPAYRVTRRAKTCAATHVSNPQSFLLRGGQPIQLFPRSAALARGFH